MLHRCYRSVTADSMLAGGEENCLFDPKTGHFVYFDVRESIPRCFVDVRGCFDDFLGVARPETRPKKVKNWAEIAFFFGKNI